MNGVFLMLATALSVQFGGAFAATLIPAVGPVGTVCLRMVLATVLLAPVARPRWRGHSRSDWAWVLALAATLTLMNTTFYFALARLPIGVAVTIEFIGPLTLAAIGSRSRRDVVAVILAFAGVVAVSGALDADWRRLSVLGVVLALVAGAWWALYAAAAQRVGVHWHQLEGLWFAMAIGSAALLPLGVSTAGASLLTPRHLGTGLAVAVMSSALPYSLEMYALRLISTKVYGIITGLEPVIAALAGFLVLGQHLSPVQVAGMAAVIVAGWLVLARGRDGSTQ